MMRCAACAVDIEGTWRRCPLCGAETAGDVSPDPLPDVPLAFTRRRVLRALFFVSLGVIALSFLAQLLFVRGEASVGALRSVWLGVAALWLVVMMAVRKRRNIVKGTTYLVILLGGVSAYWDYLTGWNGWSLSYAVPATCACSIVAVLITVRVMRTEVGEHIVYSWMTAVLGLVPVVFLALGWVNHPALSIFCGALSVVALALQLVRLRETRHELAKRLHL
ncbi:MAG: DUF6320 domain-containing protein [Microbacterium gubbeenense]|uniref:DUF6320 domain-containing protein n=1 Tax=Microbacterium gubbeenense TaxID=159896 RepID=UPI003F95FC38